MKTWLLSSTRGLKIKVNKVLRIRLYWVRNFGWWSKASSSLARTLKWNGLNTTSFYWLNLDLIFPVQLYFWSEIYCSICCLMTGTLFSQLGGCVLRLVYRLVFKIDDVIGQKNRYLCEDDKWICRMSFFVWWRKNSLWKKDMTRLCFWPCP